MKKLLIFLLLLLLSPALSAEEHYHPGDIIRFRIEALGLSPEEIAPKLSGFEVLKLERQGRDYEVWIRSFDAGPKEIDLGPVKIQFTIHSLLENTERKDIYDIKDGDQDSSLLEPVLPFFWTFFLLILTGLGIAWLVFFARRLRKSGRQGEISAWSWFNQALPGLESPAFLEELTDALKGYIERKFAKKIMGKTSSEILEELRFAPVMENLGQLEPWLAELDGYKYAGLPEKTERREIFTENLQKWVSYWEQGEEHVPAS